MSLSNYLGVETNFNMDKEHNTYSCVLVLVIIFIILIFYTKCQYLIHKIFYYVFNIYIIYPKKLMDRFSLFLYRNFRSMTWLKQYQTGIFVSLNQCSYIENTRIFTYFCVVWHKMPPPPPKVWLGLF